jgi:hypothetical protein
MSSPVNQWNGFFVIGAELGNIFINPSRENMKSGNVHLTGNALMLVI